jgi:16S rRNA (cytosine1402-N4)-methyltransferase
MEEHSHLPVLLPEVLEILDCRPGRVYVDGTAGSGGHSRGILEKSSPSGRLIGLDWDEEAIERSRKNLSAFEGRFELRRANFKDVKSVLESFSLPGVDGILLDLGVSTEQLESRERGFSFRWEAPLDMRMSQETRITAQELVQRLPAAELELILRELGEERWARRIARNIVRQRQKAPLRTTRELVEAVERSVPRQRPRIHPATRTFQALRIRVNEELNNLTTFLAEGANLLNPGGRICILSYHSLEDRIVKNRFREWTRGQKRDRSAFRLLTPKPMIPSEEEVSRNPRARSAKLRAVEKL